MSRHASILPMQTSGTHHLIERTYREGGRMQWVRELFKNAVEAGATRVEFGIDWAAVERTGVYRRVISDNGKGMTEEELKTYFNTFGAGGKTIGGVHENFGVGSKTSLLPWNHYGVVVMSWVDGEGSMIWIQRDPETGAYGLRLFEAIDDETNEITLETVVEPEEWALLKPDWIRGHGTVIVLLGNDPQQHTMLGDPLRDEGDLKGIGAYLNRRFWDLPEGVEVSVEEVRANDRRAWPRSAKEAYGPEPERGRQDRRVNRRTVKGARYYIDYQNASFKKGGLAAHGTVPMRDGTRIHWYLWDGERPGIQSYGPYLGHVGALYRGELYDVTAHLSVYRSFGVIAAEVRSKLWLIAEPRELDEEGKGVYPRTDRNALLVAGAGGAGEPLPLHVWGAEFSDQMPAPIRDAMRKARTQETGEISDETWRARLAERFGSRWKISRMRVAVEPESAGEETVSPTQLGQPEMAPIKKTKKKRKTREEGDRASTTAPGALVLGAEGGAQAAKSVRVSGGIPTYRIVTDEDVEPGMLAAWQPNDPEHPEGVVLLNAEHPVIAGQIRWWTSQYPDHLAPEVEGEVLRVYGQLAVARVAHSEKMRGLLPTDVIDREMRSDAALTMSLLGLVAEEQMIAARLGARYGKRRQAPAETEEVEALPPVAQA